MSDAKDLKKAALMLMAIVVFGGWLTQATYQKTHRHGCWLPTFRTISSLK